MLGALEKVDIKILDFFSHDDVRFKDFENHQIKGVFIGVVFSVNHQMSKDFRHPRAAAAIVDIEANILKLDCCIFKTNLHLVGVPRRMTIKSTCVSIQIGIH